MKKLVSLVLIIVFALSFSIMPSAADAYKQSVKVEVVSLFIEETTAFNSLKHVNFNTKFKNSSKYRAVIDEVNINYSVTDFDGKNYTDTKLFNEKGLKGLIVKPGISVKYSFKNTTDKFPLIMEIQPDQWKDTRFDIKYTLIADTTKAAELKSSASAKAKTVKKLKAKTKLTLLGLPSKGWVKVKAGTTTGYISDKLIK